jgi:ribosomal protein S18 acetylase RimI-like enzyme
MALARDFFAQHRRQGVARELVRHLQAQALPLHATAARELRLHVLETNKAGLRRVMHYILHRVCALARHQPVSYLRSFYAGFGFEEIGRKVDYPSNGKTAVRMAKRLPVPNH